MVVMAPDEVLEPQSLLRKCTSYPWRERTETLERWVSCPLLRWPEAACPRAPGQGTIGWAVVAQAKEVVAGWLRARVRLVGPGGG